MHSFLIFAAFSGIVTGGVTPILSLPDLDGIKITLIRTGGLQKVPLEDIMTVDDGKILRTQQVLNLEPGAPKRVLHLNSSRVDIDFISRILPAVLSLVNSVEKGPAHRNSIEADDWTLTLQISLASMNYVYSSLRHDEGLGPNLRLVFEALEGLQSRLVPFSDATFMEFPNE